jgi:hypothetical protein
MPLIANDPISKPWSLTTLGCDGVGVWRPMSSAVTSDWLCTVNG